MKNLRLPILRRLADRWHDHRLGREVNYRCNVCGARRTVTPRELGITPHRLREILIELTAMLGEMVEHALVETQPDGDAADRILSGAVSELPVAPRAPKRRAA